MDEKQKILSDMYTLRAGLCWISQKKHEIDKLKTSVQVPEKLTEQDVLRESKDRVLKLNNELIDLRTARQEKQKHTYSDADYGMAILWTVITLICFGGAIGFAYWGYSLIIRDGLTKDGSWMPCFIVGAVLLVGGFVGYVFTMLRFDVPNRSVVALVSAIIVLFAGAALAILGTLLLVAKEQFWTWIAYFGGALLLATSIVAFAKYRRSHRYERWAKMDREEFADKEQALIQKINAAEEEVENVKNNKMTQILRENQDSINEARRKIADIRKYQIVPLIELCNKFFDTLTDTFGEELDVRDWAYIDLVIYYVETNRAVSIREALQLIDRERQTQQIVASLKTAAIAICNTIKTETRKLTASIEQGFNALQSKLDSMERSFNSQMSSLQSSVEYSAAQARMLSSAQISQTDLTNALLQQNNASSEQLINDVNYIRNRLL